MKLLTLNTHSLVEKNYPEKLDAFVSVISGIKPDIVALQEVNQTASEATVAEVIFNGENKPVVSDHYGVLAETEEL